MLGQKYPSATIIIFGILHTHKSQRFDTQIIDTNSKLKALTENTKHTIYSNHPMIYTMDEENFHQEDGTHLTCAEKAQLLSELRRAIKGLTPYKHTIHTEKRNTRPEQNRVFTSPLPDSDAGYGSRRNWNYRRQSERKQIPSTARLLLLRLLLGHSKSMSPA